MDCTREPHVTISADACNTHTLLNYLNEEHLFCFAHVSPLPQYLKQLLQQIVFDPLNQNKKSAKLCKYYFEIGNCCTVMFTDMQSLQVLRPYFGRLVYAP